MVRVHNILNLIVLSGFVKGEFLYPPDLDDPNDQSKFIWWREGTVVTVEWNSTYKKNNLYYSPFDDNANSAALSGERF